MMLRWVVGACLVMVPLAAEAKRTVMLGQPLALRLEQNQPTALVFPEPLKHITHGWKDHLETEHKGATIYFITKLPELSGRFFVTGESGEMYAGTFKVGTPSDDEVYLVRQAPASKAVALTPASIMRVLHDTRLTLPGQQPDTLPAPLLPDGPLRLVQVSSMRVGDWYGMTLHLHNSAAEPLALDIRLGVATGAEGVATLEGITWPPRLKPVRISAESEVFEPGMEGRVYIVLERRP